jgi:hypothetical protein
MGPQDDIIDLNNKAISTSTDISLQYRMPLQQGNNLLHDENTECQK